MLIIGLTGGIGCGKSSAADIFARLNVDVFDTDQIAHQLTQSDGAAMPSIRRRFGDVVITQDGSLDRQKMRQLVFSDTVRRKELEQLLHPLILEKVTQCIRQSCSPYVVVAIPLLFETGDYDHLVQRVLVIDCDEQLQISRTMKRGQLNAESVKAIMAAQVNRQFRLDNADDIVVNNGSIGELKTKIEKLHGNYLELAASLSKLT